MKEKIIQSPFFLGISGAIFGFLCVNLCFWLISVGISPSEIFLTFVQLVIAPVTLGIMAGVLSQKLFVKRRNLVFWIAFLATFAALPTTLILVEARILDFVAIRNLQVLLLLAGTGLLFEFLLFSLISIGKRFRKKAPY